MRLFRQGNVAGLALAGMLALSGHGLAADKIELPGTLTWTSWSVGSSSYNQSVAIATALKNELGVNLRVIPAQADLARQLPLKDGRVPFTFTGAGAYFSQEGVFDFADPAWGPQPVRLLVLNVSRAHAMLVTGGDAGIRTMPDLKGKRVAYVAGTPSLNQLVEANLAFAGLTWDDVVRVEVPGFSAAISGLMEDRLDAAILISTASKATQLESSSRGGYYPPLPHDDTEAWDRLQSKVPYVVKVKDPIGAMIPKNGFEGGGLPLPYLLAYESVDTSLAYNMTKAMFALYDSYKDAAPGAAGFALDRQKLDFIIPYHEGAIQYFKEAGVWTDAFQAHNDKLIERQRVLASAWKAFTAEHKGGDGFKDGWMKARSAALTAAGFKPIYD